MAARWRRMAWSWFASRPRPDGHESARGSLTMNKEHHRRLRAACAAWALAMTSAYGADLAITSPDGRTALHIASDGASFSVTRHGEAVIAASPLGLEVDG